MEHHLHQCSLLHLCPDRRHLWREGLWVQSGRQALVAVDERRVVGGEALDGGRRRERAEGWQGQGREQSAVRCVSSEVIAQPLPTFLCHTYAPGYREFW